MSPDEVTIAAVGRHIREAREARGLAQAQLAEMVDVSVETISRIERATISPGFLVVARIATALEVSLDGLVGGALPTARVERRAVARLLSILREHDDATLGALGDFLRGVTGGRRRR